MDTWILSGYLVFQYSMQGDLNIRIRILATSCIQYLQYIFAPLENVVGLHCGKVMCALFY